MILKYLLLFIHLTGGSENPINFIDIRVYDNTIDLDRLLFGDITTMDDLHLPPMKDGGLDYKLSERTPEEGTLKDEIPVHIMDMTDLKLSNMENSFDVKEFNEITKSMRNITDAYKNTPGILSRRYYYQDSEDNIGKDKTIKENDKKEKLINLMITFLIHARYQIKKGLAEKQPLRGDTRYRIGYLFNRLRHLQYEQQKLVSAAQKQRNHHKFSLYSMTKLYEKLVRCDVDIRDTIKYLEEINSKREVRVKYNLPEQ